MTSAPHDVGCESVAAQRPHPDHLSIRELVVELATIEDELRCLQSHPSVLEGDDIVHARARLRGREREVLTALHQHRLDFRAIPAGHGETSPPATEIASSI